MKTIILAVLSLCFLFSNLALASLGDKPKLLLEEMCEAMNNKSYRGTFVHLHNNKIESMQIVRRKNQFGDIEKLFSLNGEAKEVIRDNNVVTCILPKAEKVTVDKARPGSQLPLALPQNLDNIEAFYDIRFDGEERIANLQTTIVSLQPKDTYRYGHRIWVDQHSKLMVKSNLLDEQGVPIEQIMFTHMSLEGDLPDSAFGSDLDASQFKRVDVGKKSVPSHQAGMLEWQLNNAPHGFTLVSHTRQLAPETQSPVEHMVLSDGMASISVFIEPKQSGKALSGPSRMGAVNAYGSVLGEHKVVVVGEVPAATVMLINQHVERLSP